jgi:sorbitol-specific phosphotransferase system component IIBC
MLENEFVEMAKIMFQAALAFSAILVAVIGILFAEYHSGKKAGLGNIALENYKSFAYAIVGVLTVSIISSFFFLFSLLGIDLYYIALGLFIFAMVSIVTIAFVMVVKFMK